MAVALTGAGSLFVRIGHWAAILLNLNKIRGSSIAGIDYSVTMDSRFATSMADYAAGTARRDLVDTALSTLDSWKNSQTQLLSYVRTVCTNTIIEMVNDDTKLQSKTLALAMKELIRQMTASSDDVNASAPAAGAQTALGSPTGTPIVVVSVKNGKGQLLEYSLAETLKFVCSADSQGTATAKREPFMVTGTAAVGDSLSQLWPGGSGTAKSITASDGAANNANGNLLQNSDFETMTTANRPDNWDLVVGTAGTTLVDGGSSNAYTGSKSIAFVGTAGAVLVAIKQTFDTTPTTTLDAGGTAAELEPETPYAFNCWVKADALVAAGVLRVSLVDGSDTIINDSAGTANTISTTIGGVVSTSWVNINGVFRLPAVLPSEVNLKIYLSTALTSGRTLYIDRACLNTMTQLYTGGPFASIFSGATNVILNDSWTIAITNTWGQIQQFAERVFGMRAMGLQLPSDTGGTETISDALIA